MLKLPENQTWVISDTHWNHKNILEYTGRPYKSLEEMNEALIRLWQTNVQPDDYIIHCGDFFMGRKEDAEPILKRLPGVKVLVWGNHDKLIKKMKLEHYFAHTADYLEVQVGQDCAVLSHFPFEEWNNRRQGWWHLCGHMHGGGSKLHNRLDVGVDAFCKPTLGAPRRWSDVRKYFASQPEPEHEKDYHRAT